MRTDIGVLKPTVEELRALLNAHTPCEDDARIGHRYIWEVSDGREKTPPETDEAIS